MEVLIDSSRNNENEGGCKMFCSASPYLNEKAEYKDEKETYEGLKKKMSPKKRECPLCAEKIPRALFRQLKECGHRVCVSCLKQHIEISINENRVEVPCPECYSFIQPSEIKDLVGDHPSLVEKYERFSLQKYLLSEPDARWCPGLDCGFAMIASNCNDCPKLKCRRAECGISFCYHCKRPWHENQTCLEALLGEKRKKKRHPTFEQWAGTIEELTQKQGPTGREADVKPCPRCRTAIVKVADGSCNHMACTMCNAEFCWLCLKEVTDMHYISPTGCTFWGKKQWSKKKKIIWQLGTLLAAPAGAVVLAAVTIPGIVVSVPVYVAKKVHKRMKNESKVKRNVVTAAYVAGSMVASPVIAAVTVVIGVPLLLGYIYTVIPITLIRNGMSMSRDSDSDSESVLIPT